MGARVPRWWAQRTPPEKRHFVARTGLIVLAVVVLVAVPAYLALRPAFLERFPDYETVYLTWHESTHAEVSCQRCHVDPGLVPQAWYGVRMLGEFYVALLPTSRQPDLLGVPTNEACDRCHTDLVTVSPSGDLRIPHRAHVEMLSMECVECHDYVVHEVNDAGTHTPTMESCLTCHDGEVAKSDCVACHIDKDPPDTHLSADWVFEHAVAVDDSCNSCHEWTERWCADCHAIRPDSHGEDFRAQHRFRVEERRNCEACHTGEFCIRCHGLVPSLNYDSALRRVR